MTHARSSGRLLLALAALTAACDPGGTALERSCRGERVLECDPYEYTSASEASLTPLRISPGDPAATAQLRVVLERCAMPAGRASVALYALVDRGGGDVRVIDLGIVEGDDGTGGDTTADDGIVEADLGNPFGDDVPPETTITLRVVPSTIGCQGDPIEIEYPTGRAFVM